MASLSKQKMLNNQYAPSEVKTKVEALIDSKLSAFRPSKLLDAMRYGVLIGGKRIRPELIVQTGRMLGADDKTLFEIASGFEMLHASTLVFDDMPCIDNDDVRRGEPTTHKVFGEGIATLAGCSLICAGIEVIAKENNNLVTKVASTFGSDGCMYGQQMDVQATGHEKSQEYLTEMHIQKTASVISNAIELGYLCANTPQDVKDTLDSVSTNLGLLYQIQNDILDVVGYDGRKGQDAKMNKQTTYPNKFGLDEALNKRDDLFKETISELKSLSAKYDTTNLENAIEFIAYRDY
jgi:geranylgeranyl pyrophosphate synthase